MKGRRGVLLMMCRHLISRRVERTIFDLSMSEG